MNPSRSVNPIESLYKSLNKEILIKVKRNRSFKGTLKSYDNHLNVLLEPCAYTYQKMDGEGNKTEVNEDLNQIILRGDSIVFIGLTK